MDKNGHRWKRTGGDPPAPTTAVSRFGPRQSGWRLLMTVGAGVLLAAWLYLAHPGWFNNHSAFTLPLQDHSTATPGPVATPPVVRASPTPATPRIGTTDHLDDIWITPMHLLHSQGSHGITPNLHDEFLIISLRISNRSAVDYLVQASDFQVLDSNGEIISPLQPGQDFTRTRLREVKLIPAGHTGGTLLFEVPEHDPAATLIYQPDTLDPSKHKEWLLR